MSTSFASKYGPIAIVAGASEGLGLAFAEAIAARGMDLLLLARRAPLLEKVGVEIEGKHRVKVRTAACDLGGADFPDRLREITAGLDVGLAIYNAASSFVAPMIDRPLEDALRVVDVNVRAPVVFARTIAPALVARGRGGLILMSSIAGFHGSPLLSVYGASKAFNIVLGESLWAELAPHGVDVLTSCAGAIRTPAYRRAATKDAPGTLDADIVAERTLDALGHGPIVIPGAVNQIARFVLGRLLPRRSAISILGRSTAAIQ